MIIDIAGKNRAVLITRKKMKNLVMRMDENGTLKVSCPFHITEKQICDFLYEKENWILKAENTLKNKGEKIQTGTNRKTVTWLGEKYPVIIENSRECSICITKDEQCILCVKDDSEDGIEEAFYNAASKELLKMIVEKRKILDEKICRQNNLPHPSIKIKYMTSRWGSCSPNKNHISISVRLIHYPEECLDYVLLHEYAHLLVPNHSKAFYDVVKQYMPDYKKYSDLLKE